MLDCGSKNSRILPPTTSIVVGVIPVIVAAPVDVYEYTTAVVISLPYVLTSTAASPSAAA